MSRAEQYLLQSSTEQSFMDCLLFIHRWPRFTSVDCRPREREKAKESGRERQREGEEERDSGETRAAGTSIIRQAPITGYQQHSVETGRE